jgi:hypothetical protein
MQKLIGRFSTFLEHVKPTKVARVTRFNGLFHWRFHLAAKSKQVAKSDGTKF